MTAEQKDEVEKKAQEILAQYQSGEQTEAAFAALAAQYSADTSTAANGGLYENIYQYQQSKNLDSWCFDASRKAGDTADTVFSPPWPTARSNSPLPRRIPQSP